MSRFLQQEGSVSIDSDFFDLNKFRSKLAQNYTSQVTSQYLPSSQKSDYKPSRQQQRN